MRLIVNPHKIELIQEQAVNEKEINISYCEFEFADEITEDFVETLSNNYDVEVNGRTVVFRNVPANLIIDYLDNYKY